MTAETLRQQYPTIGIEFVHESRYCKQYGSGQRIFFLIASNGEYVILRDIKGCKIKVPRIEVALKKIYDTNGKGRKFEIDKDTGHVHVMKSTKKDKEGEYEEWEDLVPWAKHDKEFDPAVRSW